MDSAAINQSKASEDVLLEFECEIEEDVGAELEDFVRLSHTGQFKDAHELYDECLSSYDNWYPVAAEYADCLLREGDFDQLVDFSRGAVTRFLLPDQGDERDLFHLMEDIGIRASKKVRQRRLERLWPVLLLQPPYTSLRDIDVHILEICLQILVLTGAIPQQLNAGLASHDGPWSVFQDWFYYLLDHECFWEAQRILHSLFLKVPLPTCKGMVRHFIMRACCTNIGQESVQIAVSSLIQRYVYVVEIEHSSLLAVVPWNDAITWALFGAVFVKAGEECISLFSRIWLRPSIEQYLDPDIALPLNGVDENAGLRYSLFKAVEEGDLSVLRQAVIAEPIHYTLDELNSAALLTAAQLYRGGRIPPFLNPRTVNAQDGYQRTSLHWACLSGHLKEVKLLLNNGEADAGLPDWFGCTPLHYAVRSKEKQGEHSVILELLLKSKSAKVNMKDLSDLTPLRMAIRNHSPRNAKILLEHGATVEIGDYEEIPFQPMDGLSKWRQLLSRYADPRLSQAMSTSPEAGSIGEGHSPSISSSSSSPPRIPNHDNSDHNSDHESYSKFLGRAHKFLRPVSPDDPPQHASINTTIDEGHSQNKSASHQYNRHYDDPGHEFPGTREATKVEAPVHIKKKKKKKKKKRKKPGE